MEEEDLIAVYPCIGSIITEVSTISPDIMRIIIPYSL